MIAMHKTVDSMVLQVLQVMDAYCGNRNRIITWQKKVRQKKIIPNQNTLSFMKLWFHIVSSQFPEPEFSEF